MIKVQFFEEEKDMIVWICMIGCNQGHLIGCLFWVFVNQVKLS